MTEREMEIFKAGFCMGYNSTMDGLNSEILGDISPDNMKCRESEFDQAAKAFVESENDTFPL